MNSLACNNIFWNELEVELDETLPEVVKNILSRTGYENLFGLRHISNKDISDIEEHINSNDKTWFKKLIELYGGYSPRLRFKFLPGHRKIVFQVSDHLQNKARTTASAQNNKDETDFETVRSFSLSLETNRFCIFVFYFLIRPTLRRKAILPFCKAS